MSRYLSYVHDLKNKLTLLYAISRKARQTQNLSEDKVNAVIDRINEILKILSSDFDFESEGIISLKSYGLNDLNEFLISAMNKIKLLYPDMNIEYFKLIEKWDDKIHFDKDLLYQVIENAIENSNNAQAKKVEMSLSKEND
jgi:signal transduction histidine kinase